MPRVLIIDDEHDITAIMKIGLQKKGFEVDTFNDPNEAINHIIPDQYDIMLFDLKMPGMDGVSLYKKVKQVDGKSKICFITALDSPDEDLKKRAMELGVNCFIKKPISIKELVSKISGELLR